MDDLDLYDDLDEFQELQERKSKELQDIEDKYQHSLKTIQCLEDENKVLKKKIQRIELSFQSLLDTARTEIKRKDKEIERLRKEKDDICFRRKLPNRSQDTETKPFQQVVRNPFAAETIAAPSESQNAEQGHLLENDFASGVENESKDRGRPKEGRYLDHYADSEKRHHSRDGHKSSYKNCPRSEEKEQEHGNYREQKKERIKAQQERDNENYRHERRDNRSRTRNRYDRDRYDDLKYEDKSATKSSKSPEVPSEQRRNRMERDNHKERRQRSDRKSPEHNHNSSERKDRHKESHRDYQTKSSHMVNHLESNDRDNKPSYQSKSKGEQLHSPFEICNSVGKQSIPRSNVLIGTDSEPVPSKVAEYISGINNVPVSSKEMSPSKEYVKNKTETNDYSLSYPTVSKDNGVIENTKPKDNSYKKTETGCQQAVESTIQEIPDDLVEYKNAGKEKYMDNVTQKNNHGIDEFLYGDLNADLEQEHTNNELIDNEIVKSNEKNNKNIDALLYENLDDIDGVHKEATDENKATYLSQGVSQKHVNLCTPRKADLFDALFGPSPSSGNNADSNTPKNYLNNIMGILPKTSTAESSTTTSPEDYSDCVLVETTSIESNAVTLQSFDKHEFDKWFIENEDKPQAKGTTIDLTDAFFGNGVEGERQKNNNTTTEEPIKEKDPVVKLNDDRDEDNKVTPKRTKDIFRTNPNTEKTPEHDGENKSDYLSMVHIPGLDLITTGTHKTVLREDLKDQAELLPRETEEEQYLYSSAEKVHGPSSELPALPVPMSLSKNIEPQKAVSKWTTLLKDSVNGTPILTASVNETAPLSHNLQTVCVIPGLEVKSLEAVDSAAVDSEDISKEAANDIRLRADDLLAVGVNIPGLDLLTSESAVNLPTTASFASTKSIVSESTMDLFSCKGASEQNSLIKLKTVDDSISENSTEDNVAKNANHILGSPVSAATIVCLDLTSPEASSARKKSDMSSNNSLLPTSLEWGETSITCTKRTDNILETENTKCVHNGDRVANEESSLYRTGTPSDSLLMESSYTAQETASIPDLDLIDPESQITPERKKKYSITAVDVGVSKTMTEIGADIGNLQPTSNSENYVSISLKTMVSITSLAKPAESPSIAISTSESSSPKSMDSEEFPNLSITTTSTSENYVSISPKTMASIIITNEDKESEKSNASQFEHITEAGQKTSDANLTTAIISTSRTSNKDCASKIESLLSQSPKQLNRSLTSPNTNASIACMDLLWPTSCSSIKSDCAGSTTTTITSNDDQIDCASIFTVSNKKLHGSDLEQITAEIQNISTSKISTDDCANKSDSLTLQNSGNHLLASPKTNDCIPCVDLISPESHSSLKSNTAASSTTNNISTDDQIDCVSTVIPDLNCGPNSESLASENIENQVVPSLCRELTSPKSYTSLKVLDSKTSTTPTKISKDGHLPTVATTITHGSVQNRAIDVIEKLNANHSELPIYSSFIGKMTENEISPGKISEQNIGLNANNVPSSKITEKLKSKATLQEIISAPELIEMPYDDGPERETNEKMNLPTETNTDEMCVKNKKQENERSFQELKSIQIEKSKDSSLDSTMIANESSQRNISVSSVIRLKDDESNSKAETSTRNGVTSSGGFDISVPEVLNIEIEDDEASEIKNNAKSLINETSEDPDSIMEIISEMNQRQIENLEEENTRQQINAILNKESNITLAELIDSKSDSSNAQQQKEETPNSELKKSSEDLQTDDSTKNYTKPMPSNKENAIEEDKNENDKNTSIISPTKDRGIDIHSPRATGTNEDEHHIWKGSNIVDASDHTTNKDENETIKSSESMDNTMTSPNSRPFLAQGSIDSEIEGNVEKDNVCTDVSSAILAKQVNQETINEGLVDASSNNQAKDIQDGIEKIGVVLDREQISSTVQNKNIVLCTLGTITNSLSSEQKEHLHETIEDKEHISNSVAPIEMNVEPNSMKISGIGNTDVWKVTNAPENSKELQKNKSNKKEDANFLQNVSIELKQTDVNNEMHLNGENSSSVCTGIDEINSATLADNSANNQSSSGVENTNKNSICAPNNDLIISSKSCEANSNNGNNGDLSSNSNNYSKNECSEENIDLSNSRIDVSQKLQRNFQQDVITRRSITQDRPLETEMFTKTAEKESTQNTTLSKDLACKKVSLFNTNPAQTKGISLAYENRTILPTVCKEALKCDLGKDHIESKIIENPEKLYSKSSEYRQSQSKNHLNSQEILNNHGSNVSEIRQIKEDENVSNAIIIQTNRKESHASSFDTKSEIKLANIQNSTMKERRNCISSKELSRTGTVKQDLHILSDEVLKPAFVSENLQQKEHASQNYKNIEKDNSNCKQKTEIYTSNNETLRDNQQSAQKPMEIPKISRILLVSPLKSKDWIQRRIVINPNVDSSNSLKSSTLPDNVHKDTSNTLKSSTLSDCYNIPHILPSISTNCPTPSNFSGIFSKNPLNSVEDVFKGKKKSPKLKEFILPAASVLCNRDNLENATKATEPTIKKKLHWELLKSKNEMAEIEDDNSAESTDKEKKRLTKLQKNTENDDNKAIQEQEGSITITTPSKDLRCLETLNKTVSESEETKLHNLNIGAMAKKKTVISRRNTIDTVPITRAVSYYKQLEELENFKDLTITGKKSLTQPSAPITVQSGPSIAVPAKVIKYRPQKPRMSKKLRAKLMASSPIRVRSTKSLMDASLYRATRIKKKSSCICPHSKPRGIGAPVNLVASCRKSKNKNTKLQKIGIKDKEQICRKSRLQIKETSVVDDKVDSEIPQGNENNLQEVGHNYPEVSKTMLDIQGHKTNLEGVNHNHSEITEKLLNTLSTNVKEHFEQIDKSNELEVMRRSGENSSVFHTVGGKETKSIEDNTHQINKSPANGSTAHKEVENDRNLRETVQFKTPTKKESNTKLTINDFSDIDRITNSRLEESPPKEGENLNTSTIYHKEHSSDEHNSSLAENSEPECNKYLKEDDIPAYVTASPKTVEPTQIEKAKEQGVMETEVAVNAVVSAPIVDALKQPDKSFIINYKIPKLKKSTEDNGPVTSNRKKTVSLEDIGLKVRPFKGHLSSFRIPKVNDRPKDNPEAKPWVIESYIPNPDLTREASDMDGQQKIEVKSDTVINKEQEVKEQPLKERLEKKEANTREKSSKPDIKLKEKQINCNISRQNKIPPAMYLQSNNVNSTHTSEGTARKEISKTRRKSNYIPRTNEYDGPQDNSTASPQSAAKSAKLTFREDNNNSPQFNNPSLKTRRKSLNIERIKRDSSSDDNIGEKSTVVEKSIETSKTLAATVNVAPSIKTRRKSVNIQRRAVILSSSDDEESRIKKPDKQTKTKDSRLNGSSKSTEIKEENTDSGLSGSLRPKHKEGEQHITAEMIENKKVDEDQSQKKNNVSANGDDVYSQFLKVRSEYLRLQKQLLDSNLEEESIDMEEEKSHTLDRNETAETSEMEKRKTWQQKKNLNDNSSNSIQMPRKSINSLQKLKSPDKNEDIKCGKGRPGTSYNLLGKDPVVKAKNPPKTRRKSMYTESKVLKDTSDSSMDINHQKYDLRNSDNCMTTIGKRRKSLYVDKNTLISIDESNTTPIQEVEPVKQLRLRRKSVYVERNSLSLTENESSLNMDTYEIVNEDEADKVSANKSKNPLKGRRKSMHIEKHNQNASSPAPKKKENKVNDIESDAILQNDFNKCSANNSRVKAKEVKHSKSQRINKKLDNVEENKGWAEDINKNKNNNSEDKSSSCIVEENSKQSISQNAGRISKSTKSLRKRCKSIYIENPISNTTDQNEEGILKLDETSADLKLKHSLAPNPQQDIPRKDTDNQSDSDTSTIIRNINTNKMRRKSLSIQRRILESSDDEANDTRISPKTVIPNENIVHPPPASVKHSPRKRRAVKVLSTSYEDSHITKKIKNNTEDIKNMPCTSPTLSHPIFHTNVREEPLLNISSLTNLSHDDRFNEIDSTMQDMFRSPQRELNDNSQPAAAQDSMATIITKPLNDSIINVTINETVCSIQENEQSSLNISELPDSTLSHNQSESKHLSLGSSDYRFEKVSENVVNLFISRKRKRKRTN